MTKRIIINGRSSSGKSSVLKEIGRRGFVYFNEIPRTVLNEMGLGTTPEEIGFRQIAMYERQRGIEENFVGNMAFYERSLVDIFAYCELFVGKIPFEHPPIKFVPRYHKVFSLEKLPFESDDIRIEKDEEEAQKIYDFVNEYYSYLGIEMVPVPAFGGSLEKSIKKRADFILTQI